MSFTAVRTRFAKLQPLYELSDWTSPYRLLFGAGYSIGAAEAMMLVDQSGDIPYDLSSHLAAAVIHNEELRWFGRWKASYLLTNAIFRVAAAAEKICYLAEPGLAEHRGSLWEAVNSPTTAVSQKLPKAYQLLGGTANRKTGRAISKGSAKHFLPARR